jgi:hypothetical protein
MGSGGNGGRALATREEMDAAIRAVALPHLRSLGFKGSLPHLHRLRAGAADLLTFQFRSAGGSFVIELGRIGAEGFDFHGRRIALAKAKTSYLNPQHRHRLGAPLDVPGDHWFDFITTDPDQVARDIVDLLDRAEVWELLDGWPVRE